MKKISKHKLLNDLNDIHKLLNDIIISKPHNNKLFNMESNNVLKDIKYTCAGQHIKVKLNNGII